MSIFSYTLHFKYNILYLILFKLNNVYVMYIIELLIALKHRCILYLNHNANLYL